MNIISNYDYEKVSMIKKLSILKNKKKNICYNIEFYENKNSNINQVYSEKLEYHFELMNVLKDISDLEYNIFIKDIMDIYSSM